MLAFSVSFTTFLGTVAVLAAALGHAWLVLLFGLPTIGAVATTVTTLTRWWWSRQGPRPAVLATAPSGAPATAYLRPRAALLPAATVAFGFLVLGGLTVLVGAGHGSVGGVVLGGLVAAYAVLLVLPFGLGATAGGVYLTRDGVEHRWGLATTSLSWAQLQVPRAELPFGLWLAPDAEHRTRRPLFVPTDTTDRVPSGYAAVPPAYLPLTVDELVTVLQRYRDTPQLQAQAGTADSTRWDLTGRSGAAER